MLNQPIILRQPFQQKNLCWDDCTFRRVQWICHGLFHSTLSVVWQWVAIISYWQNVQVHVSNFYIGFSLFRVSLTLLCILITLEYGYIWMNYWWITTTLRLHHQVTTDFVNRGVPENEQIQANLLKSAQIYQKIYQSQIQIHMQLWWTMPLDGPQINQIYWDLFLKWNISIISLYNIVF